MNKNSALLADLKAEDITLTGNSLVPEFKPDIYDYKYFVQSDIYGIKLYLSLIHIFISASANFFIWSKSYSNFAMWYMAVLL